MATESITSWVNFLKDMFVEGNIGSAMNDNILLYNLVNNRGKITEWGGNQIEFPVQDQRQAGVGAVDDGSSTLPVATQSNALRPTFSARRVYGVGEIDDMAIEDSRGAGTGGGGNDFAYVSALEKTRDDLLLTLKQAVSAWWYDDGRGRLAIMPAADNQAQITVSQPVLVHKGYRVDLIDNGDDQTKHADSVSVDAVTHAKDSGTSSITLSSAASGTGAGDYIVFEDFISSSGGQRGPFGLRALASSANPSLENFGGINRSTSGNEIWQGNRDSNSGTNRPFSVRLISDNLELLRRRSATSVNPENLVGITNWQIINEMFEQDSTDALVNLSGKEVQDISMGFAGGAGRGMRPVAQLHGAINIHGDEAAPANTMFFMNIPEVAVTQVRPPQLVDRGGGILHRFESRPAYQFRYLYFHEMFTRFPSSHLIVEDIAHS